MCFLVAELFLFFSLALGPRPGLTAGRPRVGRGEDGVL